MAVLKSLMLALRSTDLQGISSRSVHVWVLSNILSHFSVDGYDELLKVLDENDPLKHLRGEFRNPLLFTVIFTNPSDEFVFPQHIRDDAGQKSDDVIYFLGNSLGLMPRRSKEWVSCPVRLFERCCDQNR